MYIDVACRDRSIIIRKRKLSEIILHNLKALNQEPEPLGIPSRMIENVSSFWCLWSLTEPLLSEPTLRESNKERKTRKYRLIVCEGRLLLGII